MVKEVQQTTRSEYLYLTVVSLLKKGIMPKDICSKLNIKKQKLQYYLSSLKQARIIKKIGYGTWEILKEYNLENIKTSTKINIGSSKLPGEVNICTSLKSDNVRGHAFMFHLKIPKIRNWAKKSEFFEKKSIKHQRLRNNGLKITYKGKKVHLWRKSIIIYDRESYIAKKAKNTKSTAVYHFLAIIKALEAKLGVSFTIHKKYQFKVTREHYALIKNCLARQYDKEGNKLQVYNHEGLWMLIDNSYNLHETETVKTGDAIADNEGIQKYFNSHKATGFKVTPEFILGTMNGIQQNQLIFDNNMKTHLEVLKKLGNAVDNLTKEIKKK